MKRKIICLLLCLILLVPVTTAFAETQKIVDDAWLLWYSEKEELEQKAQKIVEDYAIDVVILTVDYYTEDSIEAFADDYFDYNGYGVGEDHSGVLLVISMEERDWAISTCGEAIYALTDYGIEVVFSEIAPYLARDDFYGAFKAYLDILPYFFDNYRQGTPIDGVGCFYEGPGSFEIGTQEEILYYEEETEVSPLEAFLTVIGMSMIPAAIIVLILRGTMNNKRGQYNAQSYLKDGSYNLRLQQDIYLYSEIHKVKRETENSRSGGSSVHHSSSGRSHGGGHGKF